MSWGPDREKAMRLWIRQLVSLSSLYMDAASWGRYMVLLSTIFGALGTVYTLPGYGCGLVTGQVCSDLQWSGIVLGILVGVSNMLVAIYNPGAKKKAFENASKRLMKISRKIDTELSKEAECRMDAAKLRDQIVEDYDDIVDHNSLPWFIKGEHQLINISLLQGYSSEQPLSADLERGRSTLELEITERDRVVMNQIQHELKRLDGVE